MNLKNLVVITTSVLLAISAYNNVSAPQPLTANPSIGEAFNMWRAKHGKNYNSVEENKFRLRVFLSNYLEVDRVNDLNLSYKLGLNKFSDMTNEEIQAKYFGFAASTEEKIVTIQDTNDLPTSVDWRTKGIVAAVKDQGHCGSCWAFSAVAAVEGAMAQSVGNLATFSEQQLVDCSILYGNHGCNGGLMDNAFKYVKAKGLTTEDKYPYKGKDGTCDKAAVAQKVAHIKSHTDVSHNNQEQLQAAAAARVVSVAIQANNIVKYTSGIFDDKDCGTQLNHGVAVVGYGTDNNQDYWLVRNSWGAAWGEQGYIRMARSNKRGAGMCGIAMQPSYPIV